MDYILLILSTKIEELQYNLQSKLWYFHSNSVLHSKNLLKIIENSILRCLEKIRLQQLNILWKKIFESYSHAYFNFIKTISQKKWLSALINKCYEALSNESIKFWKTFVLCVFIIGFSFILGWKIARQIKCHNTQSYVAALALFSFKNKQDLIKLTILQAPVIQSAYDVLIEVKAACFNSSEIDLLNCHGTKLKRFYPNVTILGRECSGIILEIGCKVTNLKIGDRIWAAVPIYYQGVITELAVIPSQFVGLMPDSLTFEEAAALPYSCSLAWYSLQQMNATYRDKKPCLLLDVDASFSVYAAQLLNIENKPFVSIGNINNFPLIEFLGASEIYTFEEMINKENLKE